MTIPLNDPFYCKFPYNETLSSEPSKNMKNYTKSCFSITKIISKFLNNQGIKLFTT